MWVSNESAPSFYLNVIVIFVESYVRYFKASDIKWSAVVIEKIILLFRSCVRKSLIIEFVRRFVMNVL